LVPESGDSIQAMKAGLMEIADVFVVNKADRPGADGLAREIEASLHDGEGRQGAFRVIKCVATENQGIDALMDVLMKARAQQDPRTNRADPARLREEGKALLRGEWEKQVNKM